MNKVVNAEARATLYVMKNMRMRDKTRYAQRERERERERERDKEYNYIPMATITKATIATFTKGYKVTLYSDSLRATTLYVIYINGPTWAVRGDSVNTSIIHLYSTVIPSQGGEGCRAFVS